VTFLLIPLSFLSISCFSLDLIFPVWLSMALSCALAALILMKNPLYSNFLSIYFIVLYSLPFIHGFEYIGFDFDNPEKPRAMWGLLTNAYTFSEPIINRTFMLAWIGLLAMGCGVMLVNVSSRQKSSPKESSLETYQAQTIAKFMVFLGLAFLLSWLNTPKDSIFLHSYGSPSKSPNQFNFNASWMLSYILLVALFIDQEFMKNSVKNLLLKRVSLFGAVLYIVIFHQFGRGDRECITLLAAFAILFVVKSFQFNSKNQAKHALLLRKMTGLLIFTGLLLLTANIVGSLRSILSLDLPDHVLSRAINNALAQFYAGTWSAVLLTPLSVAGDFYLGLMDYRLGTTYIDSLFSLIPSPISRMIDYVRPIEGTHGPAWEMRFGIGGTHVLVVPYMNFGSLGVYCILFAQAAVFAWIDNAVRYNNNFSKIFLFGSLIVIGPHWYWYGDMSLVRGVMAYAIAWLLYCILALKAPRPLDHQLS